MRKLVLVLLIPSFAFAQKIENLKAEAQGEKIIITYDLTQGQPGNKYTISLYSSHNNYTSAVNGVTGDVGDGVTEGKSKRIVWDSKTQLGNYKGSLSFEVHALVIAPLTFTKTLGSTKRGKSVQVVWRGGDQKQDVKLELLVKGKMTTALGTLSNRGLFEWRVPSGQKTGSDYQVRLTNGREIITTDRFSIRHKIPLIVKLLPLFGAAAVLSIGGGSKTSGSGSKTSGNSTLTGPPDLGLN